MVILIGMERQRPGMLTVGMARHLRRPSPDRQLWTRSSMPGRRQDGTRCPPWAHGASRDHLNFKRNLHV